MVPSLKVTVGEIRKWSFRDRVAYGWWLSKTLGVEGFFAVVIFYGAGWIDWMADGVFYTWNQIEKTLNKNQMFL